MIVDGDGAVVATLSLAKDNPYEKHQLDPCVDRRGKRIIVKTARAVRTYDFDGKLRSTTSLASAALKPLSTLRPLAYANGLVMFDAKKALLVRADDVDSASLAAAAAGIRSAGKQPAPAPAKKGKAKA